MKVKRDFTYIDDVVKAIYKCCSKPAYVNNEFKNLNPDPSTSFAKYRIFNIGNSKPTELLTFIELLEKSLGEKAIKNFLPIQPGDVEATSANTDLLKNWIGFKPATLIELGIEKFAKWYLSYYKN